MIKEEREEYEEFPLKEKQIRKEVNLMVENYKII